MLVLLGPSGCGKDAILGKLKNQGFTPIISYATRPMREGEVEGVAYKFISLTQFSMMKACGEFVETTEYCDNYYGMLEKDTGFKTVVIVEPNGLDQLKANYKGLLVSIYIDVPENERMIRMIKGNRGLDNAYKRIVNDRTSFKDARAMCDFGIENDNLDTAVELAKKYYAHAVGMNGGKG